jgi:hypothetical protein
VVFSSCRQFFIFLLFLWKCIIWHLISVYCYSTYSCHTLVPTSAQTKWCLCSEHPLIVMMSHSLFTTLKKLLWWGSVGVCASLHFHVTHVITLCLMKVTTLLCHFFFLFGFISYTNHETYQPSKCTNGPMYCQNFLWCMYILKLLCNIIENVVNPK